MELTKSTHKAFFYQRITQENGQARSYPLDKLGAAISTSEKLVKDAGRNENTIEFSQGEVKFTAQEWVFLKEVLDGIREATLPEGVIINELKDIFKE